MSKVVASDAALAAVMEVVATYRLYRPVLCILRRQGQNLVRSKSGAPTWTACAASEWGAVVHEWESLVGLAVQPEPWHGLELLCDASSDKNTQLALDVVDGFLHVEEKPI